MLSKTELEVRSDRYFRSFNVNINLLNKRIPDIDEKNLSYAKRNILSNDLKNRIRPLLTTSNDPLIPLDSLGLDQYVNNLPLYLPP